MESINVPELVASSAITMLVVFILGNYLKSYFEQKGKNFADKNDIAEITRKVEDVKNQYSSALAILNANLSLASKGLESFEKEAFNSYLEYNQTCSYLLHDLSNFDFTLLSVEHIETLKGHSRRVMEGYKMIRLSKAKHDLFNDNKAISDLAFELQNACITYVAEMSRLISAASDQLSRIKEYNEKGAELFMSQVDNPRLVEMYSKWKREAEDELKLTTKRLGEYVTGDEFSLAIRKHLLYQAAVREYTKNQRARILQMNS